MYRKKSYLELLPLDVDNSELMVRKNKMARLNRCSHDEISLLITNSFTNFTFIFIFTFKNKRNVLLTIYFITI